MATSKPSYCTCPGPHLAAPEAGTSPSCPEGVCDPNYLHRREFLAALEIRPDVRLTMPDTLSCDSDRAALDSRGFSLIECMVVVVIIGLLAAIGIPNFCSMCDRAKEARVKANMVVVQHAAEDFNVSHDGVYPETAEDAMAENAPLINPFDGSAQALGTAPAPWVPGIVSYAHGTATQIGGTTPGSMVGFKPATNGYTIAGMGKNEPLGLMLRSGE